MLINIDWLQIHCSGIPVSSWSYDLELQPYTTQVFRKVYNIKLHGKEFGNIVCDPISPILDPLMCIFKLNNRVLYEPNLFEKINAFLNLSNLTYKGITRLDICCDFNNFHNNLNPHNLIKKFFTLDYRYVGKSDFKAIGRQSSTLSFDYLRFGGNNSKCSAYLYNKTKELQEVKQKAWITDCWMRGGLDVNATVWRLEFSIKGNQIKLLDKSNGDILDLSISSIYDPEFCKKLYYSLQAKYFHFKRNTGIKNVTEMPDLQLLPTYIHSCDRLLIHSVGDGGRADKIFIKKLENLNCELRTKRRDIIEAQQLILEYVVEQKGLEDFYDKKIHGVLTDRNRIRKQAIADEKEAAFAMRQHKKRYKKPPTK